MGNEVHTQHLITTWPIIPLANLKLVWSRQVIKGLRTKDNRTIQEKGEKQWWSFSFPLFHYFFTPFSNLHCSPLKFERLRLKYQYHNNSTCIRGGDDWHFKLTSVWTTTEIKSWNLNAYYWPVVFMICQLSDVISYHKKSLQK